MAMVWTTLHDQTSINNYVNWAVEISYFSIFLEALSRFVIDVISRDQ